MVSNRRLVYSIFAILVILSLACSLPGLSSKPATTPAASPSATAGVIPGEPPAPAATPTPLPPALVETYPAPGSEIPLSQPITLYFNQEMDIDSVQAALSGQPTLSGSFTWDSGSSMTFTPDAPFLPETELTITLGSQARSRIGLALLNPLSITYHTTGYLKLTQALPEAGAGDVDPTSAVVAAFNRPVVPLGADPAELPAGFTITSADGAPAGQGEWTNTATYIFYPEPGLAGGVEYTVSVSPSLSGADGAPLQADAEGSPPLTWSFTTALPRLVSISPDSGSVYNRLDTQIVLTFSQPMSPASTEAAFTLSDSFGQAVSGVTEWSDDGRVMTFTPAALLARGAQYNVALGGLAQAAGGTPLGQDVSQAFYTVPDLAIYGSNPDPGNELASYTAIELYTTSFLPVAGLEEYIHISPQVSDLSYYFDTTDQTLRLFGSFQPAAAYTLTLDAALPDEWGSSLGDDFILPFRTGPLEPGLFIANSTDMFFQTPAECTIVVQATNLSEIPMSVGSVPLDDFMLMAGMNGYDIRQTYQPFDQTTWVEPVNVTPNQIQPVEVPLSPDGSTLAPGLYYLRMDPLPGRIIATPYLGVVSNLNLTFKLSPADALVWAVDLRSGEPAAGETVTIYDENGLLQAQGQTDENGLFRAAVGPFQDSYLPRFAVIGEPGQDTFGLAVSTWTYGLDPYNFNVPTAFDPPGQKAYLYTDRPIYRPGQTVYFRAVVRDARNGRYGMPQATSFGLNLYDDMGQPIASYDLPLSAFGTAAGEFTLPSDAQPGFYRLGEYPWAINFAVAEYRKPEINLAVTFAEADVLDGQPLEAEIEARYFFDAPASNVPVQWSLYELDTYFDLPGYVVGESDFSIYGQYDDAFIPQLGSLVDSGEAITGPDGTLHLWLEPPEQAGLARRLYTLEVTLTDETGLPVSGRGQVYSNPAPFYIGLRPGRWFGEAGEALRFDVLAAAWDGSPSGEQSLVAEFNRVWWVRDADQPVNSFGLPNYVKQSEEAGSADFRTGPDGRAALSFTPETAGTYELRVYGRGVATSLLLWVGGAGQAAYPELPNQRLTLTPGQDSYRPGDTASVFIPNPFGVQALALVNVERSETMRSQVVQVSPEGLEYTLPLSLEDAPTIYLSVTMLGKTPGGNDDFRQGYVGLQVDASELELNVELDVQPAKAGPGDEITVTIKVSDSDGNPVQGEFSLAVVDLAALALADPNSVDIESAFYAAQPLMVRTALDLAVSTRRFTFNPGGRGGGGGGSGSAAIARENFTDTALWNPQVVTGANGMTALTLTLPDNLTTWQVDVRGADTLTRVGEARTQVVTSKDLLVRPVTPRFLVAGDHVLLSTVVQNNTAAGLDVTVSLQAAGVVLDDGSPAERLVAIPANDRARVEWWVRVDDVEAVELVFSAAAGELQDAARPYGGDIPVIGYLAPQAFATAGVLDGSPDPGGLDRLELVSLPRSFDPRRGELRLELSPSLGAALIRGLDALEESPYETTDLILARFLPNLETYRALSQMGIDSPDLRARLDRTLQDGLARLIARQNDDGGWGWWPGTGSDTYITSYVLFGLARCRQEGIQVDQGVIDRGIAYLQSNLPAEYDSLSGDELDRLAFTAFVLIELDQLDPTLPGALYDRRDQISPWAQALLALAIHRVSPEDAWVTTLLSDIQGLAVQTGASVHWEDRSPTGRNYSTPLTGTAIVVYALAQLEPASTLIPNAVRYLMAHRSPQGGWNSSYETAWATMAVVEVMKGTGEWTAQYAFEATLNGAPFASGQAEGAAGDAAPVTAAAALDHLYPDTPNALAIHREAGDGRLYYTAYLDVNQPVDTVAPLNRGVVVERSYYSADCPAEPCQKLISAAAGQSLQVRVTVVLPEDAYSLVVEDYIPAGSEVLDTTLKTAQLGEQPPVDLAPGPRSMAWWYFTGPRIYDDHVTWAAEYVPAGTYELVYTLVLLQPGEYRVIPARAWQFYFPEVQGNSAGVIFTISSEVTP